MPIKTVLKNSCAQLKFVNYHHVVSKIIFRDHKQLIWISESAVFFFRSIRVILNLNVCAFLSFFTVAIHATPMPSPDYGGVNPCKDDECCDPRSCIWSVLLVDWEIQVYGWYGKRAIILRDGIRIVCPTSDEKPSERPHIIWVDEYLCELSYNKEYLSTCESSLSQVLVIRVSPSKASFRTCWWQKKNQMKSRWIDIWLKKLGE